MAISVATRKMRLFFENHFPYVAMKIKFIGSHIVFILYYPMFCYNT